MIHCLEHEHTLRNFNFETVKIVDLKGHDYNSHVCGYVTPSGTVFRCEPYGHLNMLKDFVETNYKELFDDFCDYCHKNHIEIVHGFCMSIYETFFMIECGWVKIAAYLTGGDGRTYDWKLERIYELTENQIDKIFKK